MAVYEVTKKGKISRSGYFSEIFFIRKKILGIPFYNLDIIGDTPLGLLTGLLLFVPTIGFPLSYLIGTMSLFYTVALIPLWYSWHLICKRVYDNIDDAKDWIESKIKCDLVKKDNVVLKYVKKGNTIEIDKFLN
jgi:hypothetical protein